MKKIWKILTTLTVPTLGVVSMASMSSCSNKMYHGLKDVAPYLHELTFDDYVYDSEFITTKDAETFGCSSVRKGNFYGRNFDYVFNDTPEFVVRVRANKEKGRHESIGIATHFGLRETKLLKGDYDEQLKLVPNITLDGINDAGVICSHNVVSMEPDGLDEEGKPTILPETNPGHEEEPNVLQLHQLFVPRYILDNADSVESAIDLLTNTNLNIVGDLGGKHHLHIMIADRNRTVVVEFFENNLSETNKHFHVVVKDKTETSEQEYGLPIMTNFYVNKSNDPKSSEYYFENDEKNGVERYAILKDGYEKVNSFATMEALMKKVMFSISYLYVHNPVPLGKTLLDKPGGVEIKGDLTSEWYSESFKQHEINDICVEGATIADLDPITYVFDKLKQDYWITRMMDFRKPSNPAFWQTTHNSTYDMETKHLRVTVQEQYETYFDYYL